MIDIVTGQAFEKAEEMLEHIPNGLNRAVSAIMSRANTAVKTETLRGITKVYDIKLADIRDRKKTMIRAGTQKVDDGIVGYIRYSGVALPLYRFGVTPTQSGTGQVVQARIRQDHAFERYGDAFIAQMRSGHTGVFERDARTSHIKERLGRSKNRETLHTQGISEKTGASVAAMAADSGVQDKAEAKFEEIVANRLDHEIHRILHGYGVK